MVKINAVSTHESRESLDSECKPSLKEESTKRYIYTGPPAISLGSWSERSNVNVKIKADADYKLGRSDMTNSSKTIVNINDMEDEKDITNYVSNTDKNNVIKQFNIDSLANKNPDESIAKKLLAHTTASNFKISNQAINMSDLKNEDRPVMMDVELKKISIKMPKEMLKNDENEVDTTSKNFKELIKTFGQYGNFKQIRSNINKFSADHRNIQLSEIEEITNSNVKENSYAWFIKATNQNDFSFKNQLEIHGIQQNLQMRRFTSVIGVNDTNQNLGSQNEIPLRCTNNAIKINPPMPVVKGFMIPTTDSKINNNQSHNSLSMVDDSKNVQSFKNSTMPVITGVMLKNANAKLMPVQLDPRDMLLESIRNFGGRQKLKNVSIYYDMI